METDAVFVIGLFIILLSSWACAFGQDEVVFRIGGFAVLSCFLTMLLWIVYLLRQMIPQ